MDILFHGADAPSFELREESGTEGYAGTVWTPEDVLQEARNHSVSADMTLEEARLFLEENENALLDGMIQAGWDVIAYLLTKEEE